MPCSSIALAASIESSPPEIRATALRAADMMARGINRGANSSSIRGTPHGPRAWREAKNRRKPQIKTGPVGPVESIFSLFFAGPLEPALLRGDSGVLANHDFLNNNRRYPVCPMGIGGRSILWKRFHERVSVLSHTHCIDNVRRRICWSPPDLPSLFAESRTFAIPRWRFGAMPTPCVHRVNGAQSHEHGIPR